MARSVRRDYKEVVPTSRNAWRKWLEKNHPQKESVWLVVAKKDSGLTSPTMPEAVEEALCFGWIDSTANKIDAKRFKVLFAPRKSRSGWSKINKDRVKKLIKAGLMTEAGLAVINAAKKSGRWNALDKVEAMEIPRELKKALAGNSQARKNFEAFPPSTKKAIMQWISNAKRAETINQRVSKTVELAEKNLRATQWPPPKI